MYVGPSHGIPIIQSLYRNPQIFTTMLYYNELRTKAASFHTSLLLAHPLNWSTVQIHNELVLDRLKVVSAV
jgi:hypothetical protein